MRVILIGKNGQLGRSIQNIVDKKKQNNNFIVGDKFPNCCFFIKIKVPVVSHFSHKSHISIHLDRQSHQSLVVLVIFMRFDSSHISVAVRSLDVHWR